MPFWQCWGQLREEFQWPGGSRMLGKKLRAKENGQKKKKKGNYVGIINGKLRPKGQRAEMDKDQNKVFDLRYKEYWLENKV